MTEDEQRAAVATEALSWAGTPYHHRGTIKGAGVDCAQLPMLVYAACGLFPAFDIGDYAPDWHLHRNEERYLNAVMDRAREIGEAEVREGDFALFKIGRCYAHGAIVMAWPRIVHAVVNFKVLEDMATLGRLGLAPRKYFTVW